jgi:hypothetical protein
MVALHHNEEREWAGTQVKHTACHVRKRDCGVGSKGPEGLFCPDKLMFVEMVVSSSTMPAKTLRGIT